MRSRYGLLNLCRKHRFSESVLGQRTSPYLQEKFVLLGVDHVFGAVPALAESLLGITVSMSLPPFVSQFELEPMQPAGIRPVS